jgi:hypothetical protein
MILESLVRPSDFVPFGRASVLLVVRNDHSQLYMFWGGILLVFWQIDL